VREKFFGLVQCAMAIGIALLIVRLMLQIRLAVLERALFVLWCLILVGCVLELLGVTAEISDSFRAWAYGNAYTLYEGDLRDTNMVGWPRPKVFSPEPSHVTKAFVAAVNAWLLIRVTWNKAAIVAVATLGMLTIMGSPMLLISAAITLAIMVWNRRSSVRARVMMVTASILIGVSFAAFFGASTYSNVTERVARVGESNRARASSEQQRMLYPYLTLRDTWVRSPLFGVGISGKEVIGEFTTLPVDRPETALGNNVMGEMGTYLGLVGATWFLYLLFAQARRTGVRRPTLLFAFIVLFSQLMGGIENFRYWGFIALLWGALSVADVHAERDARLPKRAQ
jgi:hypothetical protein